jgi:type IV secretion system protein VirB8
MRHWIATLQYGYVAPSKDEQLRALNTLGFRILEYRKEPEVLNESTPAAAQEGGKP